MVYMVAWMLGAVVVGWLGRKREAGFLGFFLGAVFFTPLAALMVLILSRPKAPAATTTE